MGPLSPLLTQATGMPLLKRQKIAAILDTGFDVIHWHNISLIGGPGGLAMGNGVKLCTLHDYWLTCPTHILFKDNREACATRECFHCQLVHRRPPQLWRYSNSLCEGVRHIDHFLAPSAFVQRLFRDAPVPIETSVLPNFIPMLMPPQSLKQRGPGYYLYCGRLEKAKGLQTILPLFRNNSRKLVIAGTGTYDAELRRFAEGMNNVTFLGRVPHGELASLYRGARATIVPSICYETFGLVILESLQQRTPVIASRFGALPEVVEKTRGGVVYQNEGELESVLTRFDLDAEWARDLGQTGSRNLSPYSEEQHVQQYLRLIQSAQASKRM